MNTGDMVGYFILLLMLWAIWFVPSFAVYDRFYRKNGQSYLKWTVKPLILFLSFDFIFYVLIALDFSLVANILVFIAVLYLIGFIVDSIVKNKKVSSEILENRSLPPNWENEISAIQKKSSGQKRRVNKYLSVNPRDTWSVANINHDD